MTDPRDLEALFGRVFTEDGVIRVGRERTEVAERRNLATFAHACGWHVQEEVVVPGWGRIDLVLSDGSSATRLVELKLDLTKPARIRRAFQQADGYGRWWTQTYGSPSDVSLVGSELDREACAPVMAAYPTVGCTDLPGFLWLVKNSGDRSRRLARMDDRLRSIERLTEVYRRAFEELQPIVKGDLKASARARATQAALAEVEAAIAASRRRRGVAGVPA